MDVYPLTCTDFSTPHGGGGPGSGPCCCTKELEPFLPVPRAVRDGETFRLDYDAPQSVGRVKAFYGNFGMHLRALSYILTHGPDGLRDATEAAVLNARVIAHELMSDYERPFAAAPMHEVVFTDKRQARKGVSTLDIAKRLIDYGFHPMTIYFPLIVRRDAIADRSVAAEIQHSSRPCIARAGRRGRPEGRARRNHAHRRLDKPPPARGVLRLHPKRKPRALHQPRARTCMPRKFGWSFRGTPLVYPPFHSSLACCAPRAAALERV